MGKGDNSSDEESKPTVAKTPVELQRFKLEKLMKNPDKPVVIPERAKEKKMPHVPEFVRNVMGSSAGAGSGEFHVYRHLRRKEYARQKFIQEKSEKIMLDTEELIANILQRPAIWDKRLKLHANRSHVEKCWKEISAEMCVEDHLLKKKWKYLRDQYVTELSKNKCPRSGAGAEEVYTSKWQYFQSLSFLKLIVRPRQSSGNCSAVSNLEEKEEALSLLVTIEENDVEEPPGETSSVVDHLRSNAKEDILGGPTDNATSDTPDFKEIKQAENPNVRRMDTINRIKRKRADDYQSSILETEKKNIEVLSQIKNNKKETEAEDEHVLFFKSLLPHVKKIRPEHIFPFRSKIQNIVQEFVYPVNYYYQPHPENTRKITPLSATSTSVRSTPVDDYQNEDITNDEISEITTFRTIK